MGGSGGAAQAVRLFFCAGLVGGALVGDQLLLDVAEFGVDDHADRLEVLFDHASRGRYATDASIYQIMPVGVLVPKTERDIATAIDIARDLKVPVLARGGGTSQCGQTTGAALVIDNSKHFRRVLGLDLERRTVTVEPGIVLDHLNAQIKALLTPAQWAEFERLSQSPPPEWAWYAELERVDLDASFAQLGQARVDAPLRPLPLAVLARGRSGDVPLPDRAGEAFEQRALANQRDLATLVPNARLSIARQSQHFIQQDQPAVVIEAIRQVVAGVRHPDTWYDLAACCTP